MALLTTLEPLIARRLRARRPCIAGRSDRRTRGRVTTPPADPHLRGQVNNLGTGSTTRHPNASRPLPWQAAASMMVGTVDHLARAPAVRPLGGRDRARPRR